MTGPCAGLGINSLQACGPGNVTAPFTSRTQPGAAETESNPDTDSPGLRLPARPGPEPRPWQVRVIMPSPSRPVTLSVAAAGGWIMSVT